MGSSEDSLLRSQLDDQQYEVASRTSENLLVLAPPGSGKTRILVNAAAHRIRHAEDLTGYRRARVLCVTFGTGAAREMKERLRQRPLLVPGHRLWATNYHGLGLQLLRRWGHLIGWSRDAALVPTPANSTIIEEAISDLGLRGRKTFDVMRAVSDLKGRRVGVIEPSDSLLRIRERYDQILAGRSLRDFDDLILHTITLLEQQPKVRQVLHDSYPFLFVDELQDTNVLQLELLGHLAGPDTRVFAVADDDQMIYGWRDAHPTNLTEYVERFDATEVSLVGNYRCPPNIVRAANAVIIQNDRRRTAVMESRVRDRCGEVVIVAANELTQSQAVANAVEQAVSSGVPLGEIAVLAPHKFKFGDILAELDERDLPYVRPGGGYLVEAEVPCVVSLALRCLAGGQLTAGDTEAKGLAQPHDLALSISAAAQTSSEGSSRGLLDRLLRSLGYGTTREPSQDAAQVGVLATMFRRTCDDERPASSAALAASLLLHWDRLESGALRTEQAVKVMTSFVAKGAEYQVVILPFLDDGLVPYARRGEQVNWQEARRLFYVALTRAERRVVLIHHAEATPSALLTTVEPFATESFTL
jgi:DNA helicase-2/ATP-dependent DNA helicase PcrA